VSVLRSPRSGEKRAGELIALTGFGYNALMACITIEAWKCDLCGHVWLKQAGVTPKQCAKCRTRIWNSDSDGEKAAQMIIEKKPETPRAIPLIERVRQIEAREIESEEPICEYTEYVSDIGETYRCKLPLGHRSNHRMGSQIS